MALPIEELVKVAEAVAEHPGLMERFEAAVGRIAETEAGNKLLTDAHELHGKPLEIKLAPEGVEHGYHGEHHAIYVAPFSNDIVSYAPGALNNKVAITPERFLAEHIKHAGQEGYAEAKALSNAEAAAVGEKIKLLTDPMEAVKQAWNSDAMTNAIGAKDRDTIIQLITEAHQEHVVAPLEKLANDFEHELKQNQAIRDFHDRFERPAIQADNTVANQIALIAQSDAPIKALPHSRAIDYDVLVGREKASMLKEIPRIDAAAKADELLESVQKGAASAQDEALAQAVKNLRNPQDPKNALGRTPASVASSSWVSRTGGEEKVAETAAAASTAGTEKKWTEQFKDMDPATRRDLAIAGGVAAAGIGYNEFVKAGRKSAPPEAGR